MIEFLERAGDKEVTTTLNLMAAVEKVPGTLSMNALAHPHTAAGALGSGRCITQAVRAAAGCVGELVAN